MDSMSHLEVSEVRALAQEEVSRSGGDWVLELGPFRIHNAHVSSGSRAPTGCACRGKGLVQVPTEDQIRVAHDTVVEGRRADQEADTASAYYSDARTRDLTREEVAGRQAALDNAFVEPAD